jgi:hypothetical protein
MNVRGLMGHVNGNSVSLLGVMVERIASGAALLKLAHERHQGARRDRRQPHGLQRGAAGSTRRRRPSRLSVRR